MSPPRTASQIEFAFDILQVQSSKDARKICEEAGFRKGEAVMMNGEPWMITDYSAELVPKEKDRDDIFRDPSQWEHGEIFVVLKHAVTGQGLQRNIEDMKREMPEGSAPMKTGKKIQVHCAAIKAALREILSGKI